MNRFEQRLQRRMRNPDFAAGYREMEGEVSLLHALDQIREQLHVSKEELATRMGRRRETLSRLLHAEEANPTIATLTEMLTALGVTAEITLRKSGEQEGPIRVATRLERMGG